jgi:ABC-2 type transport system ATP-binding protein
MNGTRTASVIVDGLHKRFGATQALDDVSFSVSPGEVTGFVGPNGAGKSTALRIILGLDTADRGRAFVGGRPYRELRHPLRHVGALLDASALHPSRTARNHLLWIAHSQGIGGGRVDEVLALVGLTSAGHRAAGGYSLGMRQRLGLAVAMLGDPPTLLLDEPLNGMDPEGMVWMRGFLRGLAEEGRAVLVSSHLMSELQESAHHLVVVGRGRVVADTTVEALRARSFGGRVEVRTSDGSASVAAQVLARAGINAAVTGPASLDAVGNDVSGERVVAALAAAGIGVAGVAEHRATLEQAYLELTSTMGEHNGAERGVR